VLRKLVEVTLEPLLGDASECVSLKSFAKGGEATRLIASTNGLTAWTEDARGIENGRVPHLEVTLVGLNPTLVDLRVIRRGAAKSKTVALIECALACDVSEFALLSRSSREHEKDVRGTTGMRRSLG
jgi:hypothetical protein